MSIRERGRRFVQGLQELVLRSVLGWRVCPHCASTATTKWGKYQRRPWTLEGRESRPVQRHRCGACERTYSETSADLVRRGWYSRAVRRVSVDTWLHLGSSLRRTAEWVRSWIGRQERWPGALWASIRWRRSRAKRRAVT